MSKTSRCFVVDASVLIDYAKTEVGVLALVARSLGTIWIPLPVFEEVDQLTREVCERLEFQLEQPTTEQLLEAGAGGGRLSFQDWLCLISARDRGAICVTNEKPLRRACDATGVQVLWGLELMLELIRGGDLDAGSAIQVAESIHRINPFITKSIVERFRTKASAAP